MGLKPTQKNFFEKISKTMAARGIQNFGLIEGAAELPLEQSQKFCGVGFRPIRVTQQQEFEIFIICLQIF